MNNWIIILIAVWAFGALACFFSNSPEPFVSACNLSMWIGLGYLIVHGH